MHGFSIPAELSLKLNPVARRVRARYVGGEMLRVEFTGGLGNQLFTLAGGLWLAREIGAQPVLDLSRARIESQGSILQFDGLSKFRGAATSILVRKARLGSRAIQPTVVREALNRRRGIGPRRSGYVDLDTIRPLTARNFERARGAFGFAQTRLFLEALTGTAGFPALEIGTKSSWWEENLQRVTHPAAVALHIRRGDFTSRLNRLLSVDYYKAALQTMEANVESGVGEVLVFSDDSSAARDVLWSLRGSWPLRFMDPPTGGAAGAAEQLVLMSHARRFIASNSTFSWWAAANLREGKFVCVPDEWTAGNLCADDLYFPAWVRVPAQWLV